MAKVICNVFMSIPSPCISQCQMDVVSKLCKGCWRTIDEIIAWSSHDDEAKKQVWRLIEQRKITKQNSVDAKDKTEL
jgi:uncharacterized protein